MACLEWFCLDVPIGLYYLKNHTFADYLSKKYCLLLHCFSFYYFDNQYVSIHQIKYQ